MLHLLFTRSKIIAGVANGNGPELLFFDDKPYLSYPGQSPLKAVDHYFPALVSAYRDIAAQEGSQPIPLSIALPVDVSTAERAQLRQQFLQTKSPAFELVHEDNLPTAFQAGMAEDGRIDAADGTAIIESLGQHTNVCILRPAPLRTGDALLQANNPFLGEVFEHHMLKDFGPAAGNEQVLSELLQAFSQAGLKADVKAQTDLALQLEHVASPYHFQINQETERVTLAGEIRLSDQEYEQLMTSNRERLQAHLRASQLRQQKVKHIAMLGSFLYQPSILSYLRDTLKVGDLLMTDIHQDERHLYEMMISGLAWRTAQVQELKRLIKEEEARRAQLEAEIKAKEGREQLMERLQATCVDPNQKEAYEAEFVPLAVELGIPEVVIKWNIGEALSRVSLEKEAAKAGLQSEVTPPPAPKPKPKPPVSRQENRKVVSKPTSNGEKKQVQPSPTPSAPATAKQVATKPTPVATAEPPAKVQEQPKATGNTPKEDGSRKKPSINGIFLLNSSLKGEEFPTRKATFKGDSVIKVVRLLPAEQQDNPDQRKAFEALYEKERVYYAPLGEISEIGEAKEGRYYFRDFIERTTLKDYITRSGLDKKQSVEDLSSDDLKFILQVFKSVQELPVTHANLNEDTILVVNKRRGILRRGGQAEVRFTGFTSADSSREDMLNALHQTFSRLMGASFYGAFRKQFQL